MQKIELNIVTCGNCGKPFGHQLHVTELTCPYCSIKDDISSFPDYFYPPEYQDSIFILDKKEIDVPLLQGELEQLLEGKHFHWNYGGGIHLFQAENDDGEPLYEE